MSRLPAQIHGAVKKDKSDNQTLYNKSMYLFSRSATIPRSGIVAAIPYTGAIPPFHLGFSLHAQQRISNPGQSALQRRFCFNAKGIAGYLYANIDLIGHHNHNDAIGRMTMNEQTISVAEAKGWLDNNS